MKKVILFVLCACALVAGCSYEADGKTKLTVNDPYPWGHDAPASQPAK